jgi:hypothetical protein
MTFIAQLTNQRAANNGSQGSSGATIFARCR